MANPISWTVKYFRWTLREFLQKEKTEEIYNQLAGKNQYDSIVDFNLRVKSLEKTLQGLHAETPRVLDLACGTGAYIQAITNVFPKAQVTGLDISDGMLKVAKARFRKNKRINFLKRSFIEKINFAQKFDLITFSHSLRFVPVSEEQQFVDNLNEWLKEDGKVLIVNMIPIWKKINSSLWGKFNKRYNPNIVLSDYLQTKMKKYFQLEKKEIILKKGWFFVVQFHQFKKSKIT